MSIEDAAQRGRARKAEQQQEAVQERAAAQVARSEEHRKRLDRVFGIHAGATTWGVYLIVMGVIFAGIDLIIGATMSQPRPALLSPFSWFVAGTTVATGALLVLIGRRLPATRDDQARWLRGLPYPLDADLYETELAEHDSMTGWLRIEIRFERPVEAELRTKLSDAAIGFGAADTLWRGDRRLFVRSPTFDTSVNTDTASYNTARPLHVWFRTFGVDALPALIQATISRAERVRARVGRWDNGSWEAGNGDADLDDAEPA